MFKRIVSGLTCLCFVLANMTMSVGVHASPFVLPEPGTFLPASGNYVPVMMRGLQIHPKDPLLFDFILDTGDTHLALNGPEFRQEAEKTIKYFLAALALPQEDLWVNLSPYERDRMITDGLGATELGRDMLAQDYILKQLTASMLHPEKDIGQAFWEKLYMQAGERFGAADIPVEAFNKVWITADKAKVLERDNSGYVVDAHLKVMLEADYLSAEMSLEQRREGEGLQAGPSRDIAQEIARQVAREIIVPAIEKEVNEGALFAPLRQIFQAMILASWYRAALKDALLSQVYADQGKIGGIEHNDPDLGQRIYARYLEAYRKGVFDYIKEEEDRVTGELIPRRYFSGGLKLISQTPDRIRIMPEGEDIPRSGESGRVSTRMLPNSAMAQEYTGGLRQEIKGSSPNVKGTLQSILAMFLAALLPGSGLGKDIGVPALADSFSVAHPFAVTYSTFDDLYETAGPYISLYQASALTNDFSGFTRSFQGERPVGQNSPIEQYGASSYDLAGLARIEFLNNRTTTILDTFVHHWQNPTNVVFNYNNGYRDASGNPINHLPYNVIRILGRDVPNWWSTWDWNVEQGGSAELITLGIDAFRKTDKIKYLDFARGMAGALFPLQDTDGGFRFGPIGVYHDSGEYFFWNLKVTEKNFRILSALQNLYSLTGDVQYQQPIARLNAWLQSMYNKEQHLFHTSSEWRSGEWVKSPLGTDQEYFATDVTAMIPGFFIFRDPFFGVTQGARDAEIRAMVEATEDRTAVRNSRGLPLGFKFSLSQAGEYISVEWSSQMALFYLRAAQFYDGVNQGLFDFYYERYRTLIFSLKNDFMKPASQDPSAWVAPYASYLDGSVAGGQPTGTGFFTPYSEAALVSSVWFSFALTGFDPGQNLGGPGLPLARPMITGIVKTPGVSARITIADPVGAKAYDIFYRSDLSDADWVPVALDVPVSGTGVTFWQDNVARGNKAFYKVEYAMSLFKARRSDVLDAELRRKLIGILDLLSSRRPGKKATSVKDWALIRQGVEIMLKDLAERPDVPDVNTDLLSMGGLRADMSAVYRLAKLAASQAGLGYETMMIGSRGENRSVAVWYRPGWRRLGGIKSILKGRAQAKASLKSWLEQVARIAEAEAAMSRGELFAEATRITEDNRPQLGSLLKIEGNVSQGTRLTRYQAGWTFGMPGTGVEVALSEKNARAVMGSDELRELVVDIKTERIDIKEKFGREKVLERVMGIVLAFSGAAGISEKAMALSEKGERAKAKLAGKTIVFVDDHPMMRMIYEDHLQLYSAVRVFEDAVSALAFIRAESQSVGAVVTDLNMPIKKGDEFVGDLKREVSGIPVMMLTVSDVDVIAGLHERLGIPVLDKAGDIKGILSGFEDLVLNQESAMAKGGIDLNAGKMDLGVEKAGAGVQMDFDSAMIQRFRNGDFSGITPVILQITPIQSPAAVLGSSSGAMSGQVSVRPDMFS